MIIVAGFFRVDPANRDAFLENRKAAMVRSRAEKGCHAYAMSPDAVDSGLVNLYERWETGEDLAAHLVVNRANPNPPDGFEVLQAEILRYEIEKVSPLGG
jgi:quinol monooxygenase YgiN